MHTLMKKTQQIAAITFLGIGLLLTTTGAHAALIDDFEHGTLDNWTIGGRQNFSWTADVVSKYGSLMGHVSKDGFTEVTVENLFDYSTDLSFKFDMEVRSYGGDGNTFYGMGVVQFYFLNAVGDSIGAVTYGDASSNLQSNLGSTNDDYAYNAVTPNVLLHYSLTMNEIVSQLIIPQEEINQVKMLFRGYASGYSSGMGGEVWFDNVSVPAVPIPPAVWLFGSGLIGLIGVARRKAS